MSPTLRIALRFLLARKRSMLMSLAGIVFGVGFFVLTQAQTTGFQDFFIRTIVGADGAIRIEDKMQETQRKLYVGGGFVVGGSRRFVAGVEDPNLLRVALANFSNVAAVSEVVRGNVLVQSALRNETAQIYGIDIDDHLAASDLGRKIVLGSTDAFRADDIGLMLGRALADRLDVTVGDPITMDYRGDRRRYRVDAIYDTGYRDVDKVRIYVHQQEARSLLGMPFGASFLQVMLFDRDRAPEDAARMEDVLIHTATPWQVREKIWLDVFKYLRVSTALTVSTIILISGLGMFNTLAMIVMEKTREISILRSMGYTRRDISHIFIWQGAIVLGVGALLGSVFGFLVTVGVSYVPIRLRGIFSSDTIVVIYDPWHYVMAVATAAVVVMIASLIPARRAARLEPGDVIRGTAT